MDLCPGHGQGKAPPEWIKNLALQLTILSVAADDKDGLPDQANLNAIKGYTLLRTDRDARDRRPAHVGAGGDSF